MILLIYVLNFSTKIPSDSFLSYGHEYRRFFVFSLVVVEQAGFSISLSPEADQLSTLSQS